MLSVLAAAAPAQAASRVKSHLHDAVSPSTVLIGGKVTVSGKVTPFVSHDPVVLQKLTGHTWHTIARKGTSKSGAFSFSVKATGKPATWKLRVIRAAKGRATAAVGGTLTVHTTKTAYKIHATTVSKVLAGSPVVFAGSVSPHTTGKVYLQVLHGSWKTVAAATLSHSTFTVSAMLPPKTYALRVMKPANTKIAQGESRPVHVTVYPAPPASTASSRLSASGPDDATLGLGVPRLVFSTVHSAAVPAKAFTFTNSGNAAVTVRGLAIEGPDASSFSFAAGQATTLTIPAGGSATVTIQFTPTATTDCPTASGPNQYRISTPNRNAALVFTSTDSALPGGSFALAGINSCNFSGTNEPVLDQVLSALGYTTVVTSGSVDRRFIGNSGPIAHTDEISAPYFTVANPSQPVSIVPVAHYASANTIPYQMTGWFLKGAALGSGNTCNSSCHQVWTFPGEATLETFTDNQKLLPTVVGGTTFTPTGEFGLYNDQFSDVNFSDYALNIAHDTSNHDLVPTQLLHDLRVYQAYGPGHVAIPHTYIVGVDVTRVPAYKNYDYQDVVMVLRNVNPAS